MMFHWKQEMLRFMQDASEYGSYHSQLAAKIIPHLPERANICDAGCGLGYLSLALAPAVRSITAIDIASQAIQVLKNNTETLQENNIQPIVGDISAHPPAHPYDAMIFCLFGEVEQVINIAKRQCDGVVVVIGRGWEHHRFSLSEIPLDGGGDSRNASILAQMGIPFHQETFSIEFGQPFHSLEDAVAFFRLYSKDPDSNRISESDIRNQLSPDSTGKYAYYLQRLNPLELLSFKTDELFSLYERYMRKIRN